MAKDGWLFFAWFTCFSPFWIQSSQSQVTYSSLFPPPPPIFNNTPINISVHPGDIAVLRCSIYRLATKTVTWRRKNETFPLTVATYTWIADSRISINHRRQADDQEEWNLIIRGVTEQDEGAYECQISTKPKMTRFVILTLLDAPLPSQYRINISGSRETVVGQKIFLQCDATGLYRAPDDVEWIKDGDMVDTDTEMGTIITKQVKGRTLISVLVVQHSALASAGNYVCKVAPGITSTITVHVKNGSDNGLNVKRGTDAKLPALQQTRDADSGASNLVLSTVLSAILLYIHLHLLTR